VAYLASTRIFNLRSGVLLTYRQVAIGVTLAVVFAAVLSAAYGWAASGGLLGEDQQLRYERQASGEWGVLIGGRTNLVGSVIAISDSPLIGHGSRPSDEEYSERTRVVLEANGYDVTYLDTTASAILGHGALLGAWVAAGILGVLFWLVLLRVVARALLVAHNLPPLIQPLVAFVGLQIGWDAAFSGFGGLGKLSLPITLIFLIVMTNEATGVPSRRRASPRRSPPRGVRGFRV